MRRLTAFWMARARWVVLCWAVIAVAGGVATGGLSGRLSTEFTLPGQPGFEANKVIAQQYGGGSAPPTLLVVTVPAGERVDSPVVVAALHRGVGELTRIVAGRGAAVRGPATPMRVVSYRGPADRALISGEGRTTVVLVFTPRAAETSAPVLGPAAAGMFAAAAGLPAGSVVSVTGIAQLSSGGGGGSGVLVETLIGATGALLILAVVFGSFLALLPLLIAAVSILTTFLLVDGLTTVTSVSFIVQFLVGLIGLGVAIDYSLLVVTRWREERERSRDNAAAVAAAMDTAGRSVLFAGVTVSVGLLALVVLPVPFLRSVGYGGVLIPLVSVGVSCSLLPALLSTVGPRLDWPHRSKATGVSRFWSWWAALVVRRRVTAAVSGLLILTALLIPAFSLRVGDPTSASLATSGPAHSGVAQLRTADVGTGMLTPVEVLTDRTHAAQVAAAAASVPGVRGVVETGHNGGSVIIDVLPTPETSSAVGGRLLSSVRDAAQPLGARVGGVGTESQAFNDAVYGSFPLMLAIIVLITFLLLTRAFRSLLLAAKAVLLNLLSVGATYGVLVLVWQQGHGSKTLWNVPATGAITNFVPLMVFAFLFGLSMDYEVFILARVREEYDTTSLTRAAIVQGLGRTGRLVTSAALILAFSFFALSQAPDTDLKVFATGLGAGILLDATVVRALLVPALLALFGRYNWWLPTGVATLLRIPPNPLHAETPTPPTVLAVP